MPQTQIAGHGNPDAALACDFPGQLYVDVDQSNLFSAVGPAGNDEWNEMLRVGSPSAAFSGLVPSTSTTGTPGTVAWKVVTLNMLRSYLQEGLVSVLNTKDLAAGQTDRFTQAMTDVSAEVRNAIASFKYGYQLSATPNSVPPELVRTTCYLIILAMQASCPEVVLDKDKRSIFEKAYDWQDEFLDGTRKPSLPPDPEAQATQGLPPVEVVSSFERLCSDDQLRGL